MEDRRALLSDLQEFAAPARLALRYSRKALSKRQRSLTSLGHRTSDAQERTYDHALARSSSRTRTLTTCARCSGRGSEQELPAPADYAFGRFVRIAGRGRAGPGSGRA